LQTVRLADKHLQRPQWIGDNRASCRPETRYCQSLMAAPTVNELTLEQWIGAFLRLMKQRRNCLERQRRKGGADRGADALNRSQLRRVNLTHALLQVLLRALGAIAGVVAQQSPVIPETVLSSGGVSLETSYDTLPVCKDSDDRT